MAEGHFIGPAHHFPCRVYFEDTDFSGIVYHANYLRYMERARSDMLACIGIDQRSVFESGEGVYAVSEVTLKYLRPAKFGDILHVITTIEQIRAASVTIHQRVMRGADILTQGFVIAAFLSLAGRPKRQPKAWTAMFEDVMKERSQ